MSEKEKHTPGPWKVVRTEYLIAAAPDMLAMLRNILKHAENNDDMSDFLFWYEEKLALLIDKAEGRDDG
jgi:hypothetical protein